MDTQQPPIAADQWPSSGQPPVAAGQQSPIFPTYSVRDAAAALQLPERTFRNWILEGKVQALRPTGTSRGIRIPAAAVEELKRLQKLGLGPAALDWVSGQQPPVANSQEPPISGQPVVEAPPVVEDQSPAAANEPPVVADQQPPAADEPPPIAAEVQVLEAKLDGALTAARLHAERRRQVEGDLTFTRERLVQAEQAERELRLLIAQSVQAQQQTAQELQYLRELAAPKPALPAPKKAKWWMPWKR